MIMVLNSILNCQSDPSVPKISGSMDVVEMCAGKAPVDADRKKSMQIIMGKMISSVVIYTRYMSTLHKFTYVNVEYENPDDVIDAWLLVPLYNAG